MEVKRGRGRASRRRSRRGEPDRAGGNGAGTARGTPLHRTIWYMGTKTRVIPDFLDRVVADEVPRGGTVVDLMSGTGVVAAHLADRYRVFAGDVQEYSQVIARSLLEHDPKRKAAFLKAIDPHRDLGAAYQKNLAALEKWAPRGLAEERRLLDRFEAGSGDRHWCRQYREFIKATTGTWGATPCTENDAALGGALTTETQRLHRRISRLYRQTPERGPACLTMAYYANVYFGLSQSMAIDSLRAAIDSLARRDPFREEKRVHYLSALLHTASVSTSGTSHFAQPRHLHKDSELRAMARRRTSKVWALFEEFSREIIATVSATAHRTGNRVLRGDYKEHMEPTGSAANDDPRSWRFSFPRPPDLIYLDPPYTADNYSRFYHVLEVLVRYDYPVLATNASGEVLRGRYPEIGQRFRSGFCRASSVEDEFRRVIHGAAAAGAKLVISYSTPTGLLLKWYARQQTRQDPVARLEALCRQAYAKVRTERRRMMHSGQGDSSLLIEELLVVCCKPKGSQKSEVRSQKSVDL